MVAETRHTFIHA